MKRKKSWAIAVMAAASVILGAATVYAYETENVMQVTDDYVVEADGFASYITEDDFVPDFTVADYIFIEDDGNIHYVSEENHAEPYVLCIHAYKDGYYYTHKPDSSGGCEYRKYSAQICEKCGKVIVGDLIYRQIYVKCPH